MLLSASLTGLKPELISGTPSMYLQIFLWVLKDNDLTGMAFIDTQLYIHQMMSIKNFILAADLMKSVSLLRYQEESKTLSLVSRVRTEQRRPTAAEIAGDSTFFFWFLETGCKTSGGLQHRVHGGQQPAGILG